MPKFDNRDTTKIASYGGGNWEVLLTGAEHDSITGGTGALTGWYALAYLQGGRYGEEVTEGDACIAENGDVLAPAATTEQPFWENVIIDWGDRTKALIDYLKATPRRMRYQMPYDDAAQDPQWLLVPSGQVKNQNWEVSLGDKTKRTRPVRIEFVKSGTLPLYYLKELPADSAAAGDWLTSPYDIFNDDATYA